MKTLFKKNKNSGFVILFAVTVSSILLAVALGAATIAEKEIKFGTSAKATNNAFFAADVGIENALYNDRSSGSIYVLAPAENSKTWSLILTGLGGDARGCAKVSITKTKDSSVPPATNTTVISKGYDIGDCSAVNPLSTEREIKVTY